MFGDQTGVIASGTTSEIVDKVCRLSIDMSCFFFFVLNKVVGSSWEK